MRLEQKIEAVLFWKGEPMKLKKLAEAVGEKEEQVRIAISELEKNLVERGVALVFKDDEVVMATTSEVSGLIEKLAKDELSRDIGRAGLETLSIVLYYGPISRRDIDYIRGVNSAFILRHLLVRGLVERVDDSRDQRVFLYKPTFDLLSYLGISKVEDLSEYKTVREEFDQFINAKDKMIKEEKREGMEAESEQENGAQETDVVAS